MALAGFNVAKSVVGLSKSPVFHHQYCSVFSAIANLAEDERDLQRVRKLFKEHQLEYFPHSAVNHFQTDVVNIFREHSPCLEDRQFRHKANNVIRGNTPVGIGYPLALVNIADFQSSWSLPVELQRVKSNEDEIEVGVEQIRRICESERFREALNINACDSRYGTAKYISQANRIRNLVNVIRVRHGNKVYEAESRETGGAPQVYGRQYNLIEATGKKTYHKKGRDYVVLRSSIYDKKADQEAEVYRTTKKGKKLRIQLKRWKRMKMRTKNGHSMKEVEFDLIGIKVLEAETGKRVFKQDVFAAIVGEEREKLSLEEAAEEFYHRFDLEAGNRFMKQNLFLEGYQTPSVEHLDNWNILVQEAMWLLWAASTEVENVCEKWQKYSEPKIKDGERRTASQTRKGLEGLILTFEKEKFQPKKCKKGLGRRKGEKQEKRKEYKVVKKSKIMYQTE